MDLNSNKGKDLLDFMYINHFKNYIKDFTRISTKWCPYKNKYITSKTLIDVLLHNKDLISNTDSIECPFSDHNFILSSFQIENSKTIVNNCFLTRNLGKSRLSKISRSIDSANMDIFNSTSVLEEKWNFFKDKILNIINIISPLKNTTISNKAKFPWSDLEMHSLKKYRDKTYTDYRKNLG